MTATTDEVLRDLYDRIIEKADALNRAAITHALAADGSESIRLLNKRHGLRLAASYVEDLIRTLDHDTPNIEATIATIRDEALSICGNRIARTQRHAIPGMMPAHRQVYFSDDDVRMDDVLSAVRTVLLRQLDNPEIGS